jgi:hypothetical protein
MGKTHKILAGNTNSLYQYEGLRVKTMGKLRNLHIDYRRGSQM